jgi:hypothetical protein
MQNKEISSSISNGAIPQYMQNSSANSIASFRLSKEESTKFDERGFEGLDPEVAKKLFEEVEAIKKEYFANKATENVDQVLHWESYNDYIA